MNDRNFWNDQFSKACHKEPSMPMALRMNVQGGYELSMGAMTVRLSASELMKMEKLIQRAADLYREDIQGE